VQGERFKGAASQLTSMYMYMGMYMCMHM